MKNNLFATKYIKGIAIFVVVVNHFSNIFVFQAFHGLANGFIAILFVTSGFGIYRSLEKLQETGKSLFITHCIKRLLRIYPLFWLSLLVSFFLRGSRLECIDFFFPNYKINVVYWFLNALLQCYLVAPLLFLAIKRFSLRIFVIFMVGFLLFLNLSHPLLIMLPEEHIQYQYRWLMGGHLLLFVLGMILPVVISELNISHFGLKVVFSISCLFLTMVYLTRDMSYLFPYSGFVLSPFFCLVAAGLCYVALAGNPRIIVGWLHWIVVRLGACSFSIYLFHLDFFMLISEIPLLKGQNYLILLAIVLVFPVFVGSCTLFEKGSSRLSDTVLARLLNVVVDKQGSNLSNRVE